MSEQDSASPAERSSGSVDVPEASYGPQHTTPSSSDIDRDLSTSGTITIEASWAGPLPPPSLLAEYDRIVPNGAVRIFEQFEAEARHRRELERHSLGTSRLDLIGGQVLVAIFLLGAYAVTVFAIAKGANWVAGVLGSLTTALTIFFSAKFRAKKPGSPADRLGDRE